MTSIPPNKTSPTDLAQFTERAKPLALEYGTPPPESSGHLWRFGQAAGGTIALITTALIHPRTAQDLWIILLASFVAAAIGVIAAAGGRAFRVIFFEPSPVRRGVTAHYVIGVCYAFGPAGTFALLLCDDVPGNAEFAYTVALLAAAFFGSLAGWCLVRRSREPGVIS